MATVTTTGYVYKLSLSKQAVCVWIGPEPNNCEELSLSVFSSDTDPSSTMPYYSGMISLLVSAFISHTLISARHADNSGVIEYLDCPPIPS